MNQYMSRPKRVKGRGVLDGPLITQHALFGMRPKNMPAYGVGKKRMMRPVYVSRMGMGGKRKRRKTGGNVFGQLHDYVKSNRLISKGLHALSKNVNNPLASKALQVARNFSATQGYGKTRRRKVAGKGPGIMTGMGKRKRRKRVVGGSIFSDIGDFLKKHKVLSTIGKAVTPFTGMFSPLASGLTTFAESQGYGRRHKTIGMRRGGNNPYPTTNSFYGRPVF
jgi:hypothetical protein